MTATLHVCELDAPCTQTAAPTDAHDIAVDRGNLVHATRDGGVHRRAWRGPNGR